MYAKIVEGHVQRFPYSPGELISENPNISFPANLTDELLAQWGVYRVHQLPYPSQINERTDVVKQQTSITHDGEKWTVGWDVVQKSEEEIAAYDAQFVKMIRQERDNRLSRTDWMALSDNTLTPEWAEYRQQLRDLTNQPEFPHKVVWPTPPLGA